MTPSQGLLPADFLSWEPFASPEVEGGGAAAAFEVEAVGWAVSSVVTGMILPERVAAWTMGADEGVAVPEVGWDERAEGA